MLSAVESHLGPSRAYHPFVGPTVTALVPNCHPISSFPPLNTAPTNMSAAEFARPQPKARYNGSSLSSRSTLATSPRSKYIEQTGPVNLAVGSGSAASSPHSPKMDTLPAVTQQPPLLYDAASTFSQPLNYSGLYGRPTAGLYGRSGLYPLHSLAPPPPSRAHGTYIAPQLDYHSAAPFLSAVPYSPAPASLQPPPAETPAGASILKKTTAASNAFCPPKETKNSVSFKVPSGKEGSLKHRILTRPYSERESTKRKSPSRTIPSTVVSTTTVKPNFSKGVLIDLGNGEMRRVEDMRTEDFLTSSAKTPGLELVDSTVLKISPGGSDVVVTLHCVKHKSKVHLSVYPEHPFFVYRQGWASCNPEGTLRVHGLKCHPLHVGDVCISLRQKDPQPGGAEPMSVTVPDAGSREPPLASPPVQQQPQNLSRKAIQQIEGVTYHPKYRSTSGIGQMENPPPQSASTTINHSIQSIVMSINDDQRRYQQHFHPLHHTYYNPHEMIPPRPDDAMQQESKKRRWSAPDNMHEEENTFAGGAYPPPHKLASH
ncbi:ataxin-1 [Phlebotomus argentipes]|uniref:ataxin-1 n=1 Tax=Phlebotomus argentipes TaxID=94469 RepID=UPI0028937BAF|nr:ataxin-1 [Phlebotomus argentipes]XP_059616657.1 ataxin-1 [Phlebotomus argentipes]